MTADSAAPARAAPAASQQARVVVIDSRRGALNLEALGELWDYREVLWAFVVRRIKVRFRYSIFGVGWVVLQPLAAAAVFAVLLGRLAHFPTEGVPFFLFVLAGLALWNYFSQIVTTGIDSLLAEAGVLRKVYFPREIPPFAAVLAGLVDVAVAVVVLLVFTGTSGHLPTLLWLLIPLPVLVVGILASGIGLLLSGFNVYYRDVAYGLPFLIQIGFFLSPVIYSISLVPANMRSLYQVLNPVAASVDALRNILFTGQLPDLTILGLSALWSAVLMIFGYAIFKRMERRFADSA